jgi:cytochrome b561
MQLRDTPRGYGWISIGLHWITALGIFALLFAGSSIGGEISSPALRLHTTIALCLYAVLWWRIVWRIRQGHPRFDGPTRISHRLAVFVHYALMGAVAVMLLSGPLMAWLGDRPLMLFSWEIPSPVAVNARAFGGLRSIHAWTAAFIALCVTLHISGVLKHMIFDRDDVFDRIMVPAPAAVNTTPREQGEL